MKSGRIITCTHYLWSILTQWNAPPWRPNLFFEPKKSIFLSKGVLHYDLGTSTQAALVIGRRSFTYAKQHGKSSEEILRQEKLSSFEFGIRWSKAYIHVATGSVERLTTSALIGRTFRPVSFEAKHLTPLHATYFFYGKVITNPELKVRLAFFLIYCITCFLKFVSLTLSRTSLKSNFSDVREVRSSSTPDVKAVNLLEVLSVCSRIFSSFWSVVVMLDSGTSGNLTLLSQDTQV